MPDTDQQQPPGILKQDSYDPGCASPSSYLGLSYAGSPRATPKSVSINSKPETISPLVLGKQKPVDEFDLEGDRNPRKPAVKGPSAHRLSGRPSLNPVQSSTGLDGSVHSEDRLPSDHHLQSRHLDHLVDEVSSWIRDEKEKRARRKAKKRHFKQVKLAAKTEAAKIAEDSDRSQDYQGSDASDSDDLGRLEEILKRTAALQVSHSRKGSLRHKLSLRKLHKRKPSGGSSDTEYVDGDAVVPSSDAVLDNSKTLAQSNPAIESSDESSEDLKNVASYRDFDAWASFKFEIVRLTHTLRLKGWRRVPMEMSGQVTVERLSGALTNAVYVVSPPDDLPSRPEHQENKSGTPVPPKQPPPKLLLRIYGPQVEHLIDRDAELAILKRLARKRIGPRMLGTFANGRFEEYFNAKPLTPEELRSAETSRHIAKRMRELHDGIELLDKERNSGPFVWLNWDKWVQRVEQVVSWLDHQVKTTPPGSKPTGPGAWKRRGLICGVEWNQFRQAVDKYRQWLEDQYGGPGKVNAELVFAHNDTQYGNILRMIPSGESPLLLPANSHKQLVVIDFEYANANTPGLEFANHFTEWCYNYHDERRPYVCNTDFYPAPEDQDRFIRAYVRHRPEVNVSTPKMRPSSPPATDLATRRTTSSISEFMLDARNPQRPTSPAKYDDAAEAAAEDAEVRALIHETRIWRLANTAQWVAWGIVQAKVPGMPDFSTESNDGQGGDDAAKTITPPLVEEAWREDLGERADSYRELARQETEKSEQEQEEEHEEFDYLGYAQHRAMFFWGDMLQLGLVEENELPEELRAKIKTVPY